MTAPLHQRPETIDLTPAPALAAAGVEVEIAEHASGPDAGHGVEVLKVSARSHPTSVAGAIAGVIRGRGLAEIQVVGAGALNQAVKAVAVARGFLAADGLDVVCTPSFADVEIDGEHRTAIRLTVEDRDRRRAAPRSHDIPSSLPGDPQVGAVV